MLQHVLDYATSKKIFDAIFLHVQINNDSAIEFYKKFGFEIVQTKKQYYKRIEPADAYVLQKSLTKWINLVYLFQSIVLTQSLIDVCTNVLPSDHVLNVASSKIKSVFTI